MTEDYNPPEFESKLESELFALVKSITNLNKKYQKGTVNQNFFKKALKTTMNNLLKLNFTLKENNIQLIDLLNKMDFTHEYNSAIDIINRVSSLNISDDSIATKSRTFLELPGITSEITTSFITLMDALTLEGLSKNDIIINLFEELTYNLSKFPGLDDILSRVESIRKNTLNHENQILSNEKLKEKLIEDLYQIFKDFQNKLRLKP
ncbi:MAG: hypothetical protein ACFE9S_13950 [Candidatus Hermodarchaeota archaeon]